MILQTLLTLLAASFSIAIAIADERDGSPFVRVQNCVEKNRTLCVDGVVPEQAAVALLGNRRPEVCVTKALTYFFVKKESEYVLTELDATRCPGMSFTFAYINPPPNLKYTSFEPQLETDSRVISRVDQAIRAQSAKINDPSGTYKTRISAAAPKIFSLPLKGAYIAVYANDLVAGAKTLVYQAPNGKVTKIIGIGELRGGLIVQNMTLLQIKYDCRVDCEIEKGGVGLVSLESYGVSKMY